MENEQHIGILHKHIAPSCPLLSFFKSNSVKWNKHLACSPENDQTKDSQVELWLSREIWISLPWHWHPELWNVHVCQMIANPGLTLSGLDVFTEFYAIEQIFVEFKSV